jgi:hypothetical protein
MSEGNAEVVSDLTSIKDIKTPESGMSPGDDIN